MTDTRNLKTLKTQPTPRADVAEDAAQPAYEPGDERSPSLMGMFAVGFALLGVFASWMFVPFGIILGIVCLFMGRIGWGISAIVLSVIGFITSPTLLVMLGLGAIGAWLGGFGF